MCSLFLVLGLVFYVSIHATPLVKIEVELLDDPLHNPEENEGYFEGDIDLDPETRLAINTRYYRTATWPNGIVPYEISSQYTNDIRNTYIEAMQEIETDTKVHGKTCVKFVPKTSSHHDYIRIEPHTGCHSPVGHHSGKGTVSLGHGCERKGTAMHEMLHVLGFWHEQNRYDRDRYVTINLNNVPAAQQKDFKMHTTHDSTTYGMPYNFGSIMHYGPYSFAKDKSKPTIIPKIEPNGIMGQRLALSIGDVKMIQKLYNCGSDTSHIIAAQEPTYLVNCDFEHGITSGKCNLKQLHDDQFDWTLKTGGTGVSGSGPLADYTTGVSGSGPLADYTTGVSGSGPLADYTTGVSGSGPLADYTTGAGHYLLADARHHHNSKTRIQTVQLPKGVNCIQFSYFAHGSQSKSFLVKAEVPGRVNHVIKRWDGDQPNQWTTQRINMNVPIPWFLVFEADIGSGDRSMVAIDDVKIYHGHCA